MKCTSCVSAVETGEAAAWLAHWEEDGIRLRPDAPQRSKQELDAQVPASFKARVDANVAKMTINPLEIAVAGPWAYWRGLYTQDLTSKTTGAVTHVDGKFLTILKKQEDGTWKIHRDCFTSNVPPKQRRGLIETPRESGGLAAEVLACGYPRGPALTVPMEGGTSRTGNAIMAEPKLQKVPVNCPAVHRGNLV